MLPVAATPADCPRHAPTLCLGCATVPGPPRAFGYNSAVAYPNGTPSVISPLRCFALVVVAFACTANAPGTAEAAALAGGWRGTVAGDARWLPWMALYIGPEILLPFASAIAAVAGFVMMFWRRLVGLVRRLWDWAFRRSA